MQSVKDSETQHSWKEYFISPTVDDILSVIVYFFIWGRSRSGLLSKNTSLNMLKK